MKEVATKSEHGELIEIWFYCLGCKTKHKVNVAGHNVLWDWNGDLIKPTFKPSILVTSRHPKGHSNENPAPVGYKGEYVEDRCHSYITDGVIDYLGDCTHYLKGKRVNLPEIDYGKN